MSQSQQPSSVLWILVGSWTMSMAPPFPCSACEATAFFQQHNFLHCNRQKHGGGGGGDRHLVNTKFFVTAHIVVVWVTAL